jgi:hypothetical protein
MPNSDTPFEHWRLDIDLAFELGNLILKYHAIFLPIVQFENRRYSEIE